MKLCAECGKRAVEPLAVAGRRSPFRQFRGLEIPADLQIPTCRNCGAEWIDRRTAERIDAALSEVARQVSSSVAREAIDVLSASISQRELEVQLGLSAGYLSKLKHGKETPSAQLVTALVLLAVSARRLDEVSYVWETGRLPPRVTANHLSRVEGVIDASDTVAA